jgi:DNA-binding NarL/FixJ family response regulator
MTRSGDAARPGRARRILIVDDHAAFRRELEKLISQEPDLIVCGQADSATVALEQMRLLKPDLAIVDVTLGSTNGIELVKLMKAEVPHLAILVLSVHDEFLYALRALKAGASGYLMKSEAVQFIVVGLRRVLAGNIFVSSRFSEQLIFKAIRSLESGPVSPIDRLSDRELEVLELLGRKYNTKSIASLLHLSPKTIETHRAHIKEKLGFTKANEMIRFAIDWLADAERK